MLSATDAADGHPYATTVDNSNGSQDAMPDDAVDTEDRRRTDSLTHDGLSRDPSLRAGAQGHGEDHGQRNDASGELTADHALGVDPWPC